VGREADNAVHPESVTIGLDGIAGSLATPLGRLEFRSPLTGAHNLENILCAVGAAAALGVEPRAVVRGIAALEAVPGRLERIPDPAGRYLYVDFAHTPDALRHALTTLRALGGGRLICVFGCGGDRDRAKRPVMGEIVARLGDLALVTSDNPRSEDPGAIIEEILPGVRRHCGRILTAGALADGWEGKACAVEADRRKAIALALAAARPGDTVLVAGKGHETYQIVGDRRLPFDDRRVVREALEEIAGRRPERGASA
jgi:UDP-N-acetylmuramyl-tripeptide synthetase